MDAVQLINFSNLKKKAKKSALGNGLNFDNINLLSGKKQEETIIRFDTVTLPNLWPLSNGQSYNVKSDDCFRMPAWANGKSGLQTCMSNFRIGILRFSTMTTRRSEDNLPQLSEAQ